VTRSLGIPKKPVTAPASAPSVREGPRPGRPLRRSAGPCRWPVEPVQAARAAAWGWRVVLDLTVVGVEIPQGVSSKAPGRESAVGRRTGDFPKMDSLPMAAGRAAEWRPVGSERSSGTRWATSGLWAAESSLTANDQGRSVLSQSCSIHVPPRPRSLLCAARRRIGR